MRGVGETTDTNENGGTTMARSHLLKALRPAAVAGRHGRSRSKSNSNSGSNSGSGTHTRTRTRG